MKISKHPVGVTIAIVFLAIAIATKNLVSLLLTISVVYMLFNN